MTDSGSAPAVPRVGEPPKTPCALDALVRELQYDAGAVTGLTGVEDRPLHGTTLYLAHCSLETRFGTFRAYIFQDIVNKSHIIALAHGDIATASVLHTRVHSSCVTSETLRGCDCDCVPQLEGAFKVIAKKGRGILFYLMQEGRGVGYVAKARDRMLVQASGERLSTFQAYRVMGLHKDHRQYENLPEICHLLGIKAAFIVLTNNPDPHGYALLAQPSDRSAAAPILLHFRLRGRLQTACVRTQAALRQGPAKAARPRTAKTGCPGFAQMDHHHLRI